MQNQVMMRKTWLIYTITLTILAVEVPIAFGGAQPREVSTDQLTTDPSSDFYPAWSPDGSKIVFASDRETGDWVIGYMNSDGSDQWQLTPSPGWDFCPSWSPNGTKIAFVSNRTNSEFLDLWVMDSDGNNEKKLIYLCGMFGNIPPLPWNHPSWSPDGTKIAISGWRNGDDSFNVWIVNADGTNPWRLTEDDMDNDVYPSWSPDGNSIAFQSDRSGNWDIWVVNSDGSNLRQLTEDPGEDIQPAWSRNGTRIAFVSNRTGNTEIWVMNSDKSDPKQLTHSESWKFCPTWSPDGTKIAFASTSSGNWDIWVATLAYPPGEISLLDIPSEMIVGWSYNISVGVKNDEDIAYNFTVKLSGPGFSISNPETDVYVPAGNQQILNFEVVAQEEGNRTITITLLHDSTELESQSRVVRAKSPARLRCYSSIIEIVGNLGDHKSEKITIVNDASVEAMNITIGDYGSVSGWTKVEPSWFGSIAPNQSVEIDVSIDIPKDGISAGKYNGSLIINGENFNSIEVPIIITVLGKTPELDPSVVAAIIGGLAAIIAAIIIAWASLRRKKNNQGS